MRVHGRRNWFLPVLLLAGPGLLQAGPVYRWMDAHGVTHFSETPPTDGPASVQVLVLPPPGPAGPPESENYYSVVNQAARMEAQRLERERIEAEKMRAAAALRRAEVPPPPPPAADPQPDFRYLYYPYPAHPPRRHHRHDGERRPGPDRKWAQSHSLRRDSSFPDRPLRLQVH